MICKHIDVHRFLRCKIGYASFRSSLLKVHQIEASVSAGVFRVRPAEEQAHPTFQLVMRSGELYPHLSFTKAFPSCILPVDKALAVDQQMTNLVKKIIVIIRLVIVSTTRNPIPIYIWKLSDILFMLNNKFITGLASGW